MIWINGRFSWPLVLAIAYVTLVIIAIDMTWRLVQAPIAIVAGTGLAVLVIGAAAIWVLGNRAKTDETA